MLVDGEPYQLGDSYYRHDLDTPISSAEPVEEGVLTILERARRKPIYYFMDELSFRMPTPHEAERSTSSPVSASCASCGSPTTRTTCRSKRSTNSSREERSRQDRSVCTSPHRRESRAYPTVTRRTGNS
jgi:hypothetical protein